MDAGWIYIYDEERALRLIAEQGTIAHGDNPSPSVESGKPAVQTYLFDLCSHIFKFVFRYIFIGLYDLHPRGLWPCAKIFCSVPHLPAIGDADLNGKNRVEPTVFPMVPAIPRGGPSGLYKGALPVPISAHLNHRGCTSPSAHLKLPCMPRRRSLMTLASFSD